MVSRNQTTITVRCRALLPSPDFDIYVKKKYPVPHQIGEETPLRTVQELGRAVAERRHRLGLKQGLVAIEAGISQECLSRFERGRSEELGSRKLLAILKILGLELSLQAISSDTLGNTTKVSVDE
ncbi:helix-turn-helix domain-containing protein [Pseudomonas aeruginosa]|uniref:helix-turn-helix domain-containing protein n=1 Tax=Pseudomonas TaxID=286 RepID=UPI0009FE4863|nr:helix-turn-helix domain-containing protein [Pseudomonas aeruginosa]